MAHLPTVVARPVLLILCFLTLLAPGRASAATPGPDETFHQMAHAVLAGNPEAYLAWVDHSDPVFLTEQRNWAADLERHVPLEFSLAMDSESLAVDSDAGVATARITMRWRMRTPGGEPGRERAVVLPVRLVRGETPLGHGWLYAGENWVTVEGEGVRAKCDEGFEDQARRVVAEYPRIRAHVEEGFEAPIDHVQEVKIYGDMEHLQSSIYLSYTDPLSGWNEPGEAIKIVGSHAMRAGALRALLAHELGHVATFQMGPHATDMPWWVLEGVAELTAEAFGARGRDAGQIVRHWAKVGRLAEWDQIADFRSTAPELMMHVYKQGQHLVGFVSEQWGRPARNRWLREMAQGRTLDEATSEALGVTFLELDARWRASLSAADAGGASDEGAAAPAGAPAATP